MRVRRRKKRERNRRIPEGIAKMALRLGPGGIPGLRDGRAGGEHLETL